MSTLSRAEPKIHQLQAQTLDALWHEAESLGRVQADNDWRGTYTASIRFERKSGTTITAVGKNTNIAFALADAINEAREMGAGISQ